MITNGIAFLGLGGRSVLGENMQTTALMSPTRALELSRIEGSPATRVSENVDAFRMTNKPRTIRRTPC
jgi:hypothetical protein